MSRRTEKAPRDELHPDLSVVEKKSQRGMAMRDIRNDLQERADLAQDQIRAADAQFQRMVEQLRHEHDARIADLKGALAMIAKLLELENGLADVVNPENPAPRPSLADRIKAAG
jgi:hypothetical protein